MPKVTNLRKVLLGLAIFGIVSLAHLTAKADLISLCSGSGPAGPEHTIIGGTGSSAYASTTNDQNDPHNPFLAGTVTFTHSVPGVTVNSTFSNVVIQFGTQATAPVPVPASMILLGTG